MERNDLNFRKQIIAKYKDAVDVSRARDWASRFRESMFGFFDKFHEYRDKALNWVNVNFSDRAKTLTKWAKYALDGKDLGLKINTVTKENTAETENVLGHATPKEHAVYDKCIMADNFDTSARTVFHELGHNFSFYGKTTLNSVTVNECYKNYVLPNESMKDYLGNPMEKEARIIGDAAKGFVAELKKRYNENYYQMVA